MTAKSNVRRAVWAFVACVLSPSLYGCSACEPDKSPSTHGAARQTTVAPPADPSFRSGVPAPLQCRAVTVDGYVRIDADAGAALTQMAEIPLEGWLSLAANARLVARDPRTTRETTFRGPARVRVCVDALEEAWLAAGTLQSAPGTGEVPGGEEWIVIPFGVVRFAAAALTVELADGWARLAIGGGVAFVWIASDASLRRGDGGVASGPIDEGWVRIADATVTLVPTGSPAQPAAVRSAVDRCATLGKAAHDLAMPLLGGGADGMTATQQVTTRRLARAACGVAALRLDLLPLSGEREKIAASLNDAGGAWRVLPFVIR